MKVQSLKFKVQNYWNEYDRGFSLLETILGGGIALIVGILLVGILINNSGFSYKQNALVNEGLNLNDAMAQVENYIKQAVSVEAGFIKDEVVYSADADTLILKIPALGPGGVMDSTYDFIVIEADPGQSKILRLYIFPDSLSVRPPADIVLSTSLETVQFSYQDRAGSIVAPPAAQAVGVSLSINPKTGAIGSSRSSTALTTLRNSLW